MTVEGKPYTRTLRTKRDADQWRARALSEIASGTFRRRGAPEAERTPELTFGEWWTLFKETAAYQANSASERESKESYFRHHFLPAFGELALSALTTDAVSAYVAVRLKGGRVDSSNAPKAKQGKGLSHKTINNHLTALLTCLKAAKARKLLEVVPEVAFLRVPEAPWDYLRFGEEERLIAAAEPEWRAAIALPILTGLRLGEMLALRWSNLDLTSGLLHVTRQRRRGLEGPPKGRRNRTIPLLQSMTDHLKAHRGTVGMRSEFVFSNPDGTPLTDGDCKWPLRRALAAAGIIRPEGRIGWHDLRHTFGSHLAMKGADALQIQQLMGHSSLATTMRYIHLASEFKRKAIEVLERPAPFADASPTMAWKPSVP